MQCGSFDLNAGCAGFVYELVVGASMLTSGNLDHVLVVGAETLSRVIDPDDRGTASSSATAPRPWCSARHPTTAPACSPGTSAATAPPPALLEIPAGGSRKPASAETVANGDHYLKMEGQEVFRRAVRIVVESATATLERSGVSVDDVAWFVPHQANVRIIEAAANRLGIPIGAHAREHRPLRQHRRRRRSRSSSPRPPTTVACSDGDSCCCRGFGAGLTWGSALLRWGRS